MMSALALMDEPSVQQELKMSQDQITKATEARKKQEEASRGLRELSREEQCAKRQELDKEGDKLVADILKPDQAKRVAGETASKSFPTAHAFQPANAGSSDGFLARITA